MTPGRNDPCPCGSGRKFKKCCQAEFKGLSLPGRQGEGAAVQKVRDLNQLVALFNSGRLAEVELVAQGMLARHGNEGMVWKLLGLALLMQGKDSLPALRKAATLLPTDAELCNYLGIALVGKERFAEAITSLRRALKINPLYAEACYNLNLAYMAQGCLAEAEEILRQGLKIRPDYAMAHHGLGLVLKARGDLKGAEESLGHALNLKPDFAGGYYSLGYLFMEQNRSAEAEACFRRAVEIDPAYHEARNKLGLCLAEQGRLGEAEENYRQVLASAPDNIDARFNLAVVRKARLGDENTAALLALDQAIKEEKKVLPGNEIVMLNFALGRSFDDCGDYDKAFAYYAEGARRKRATFDYNAQENSARFAQIARLFSEEAMIALAGSGDPSSTPVFVVGMPRSGTTLVEQIVASHPDIHGAGELPDLIDVATGTIGGQEALFPRALPALSKERLAVMGMEYVARTRRHAPQELRITDKQPLNFMAAGLIHLMLPNAKIIHVERNPIDTCISCFSQLFQGRMEFSYDLGELGQYYIDYRRLMEHWRNVLPKNAFLDVRYEDIVQDPETQARRLIDYCGLEWDARCLDFHNNSRVVRTASVAQVRQPVYASSVERWRRYGKHLGPLLYALGDFGA